VVVLMVRLLMILLRCKAVLWREKLCIERWSLLA
jgi:hypothetical protein